MFTLDTAIAASDLTFIATQRRMAAKESHSADRAYWLGKARRRIELMRAERGADNSQGALPWE